MSSHLSESQSESQSSPVQTVSEIYPDDSASHRAFNRDIRDDVSLPEGQSVLSLHTSGMRNVRFEGVREVLGDSGVKR